jgi:hypothetical protein
MTINIKEATRQIIDQLTKETSQTTEEIIERAVKDYYNKQFWKSANEGWEKLRSDPVAWQEELEERRLWEATLMDGLEDDG